MLEKIFFILFQKYTYDEGYIQKCWDEIYSCYTDQSRYYHNLSHLSNMLAELESIKSEVKELDTLLFSIYYHDIIYSTSDSNNEYNSAMLFKKRIANTSFQYADKCIAQILQTKEHKVTQINDDNILLDLDLKILGESKSDYQVYCQNIRKEYKIYSDTEYSAGRKMALSHLLNLSSIYKTDYFIKNYENNARQNLTWELTTL